MIALVVSIVAGAVEAAADLVDAVSWVTRRRRSSQAVEELRFMDPQRAEELRQVQARMDRGTTGRM